ncbi:MAG: hypothetical protein J7556_09565 [Acidovorax sp.]|nr:hypothetical protein [Acidovorax sp.]
MKISRNAKVELFSGFVIVSDFLLSSFLFLCGAVFAFFDGMMSGYSIFACFAGMVVGLGHFYVLGVFAKKMIIIDDLLENKSLRRFCFFCWVLRAVGRRP